MIAYLNGKLAHKDPAFVIVECNGVGYQVKISLNTYGKLPQEESIKLHTHLMVKEDSHTLFGFMESAEKALFLQLISISGVGGNTALTILSSMSPQELHGAIQNEDVNMLKRVKGIGAKTAGRIILELKGKLILDDDGSGSPSTSAGANREEALTALMSLGFPKSAMEKRLDQIMKKEADLSVEELIKRALKSG